MHDSGIDFGYPWWLSHGHLAILALAGAALAAGFRWKWNRWLMAALGALALWSLAAFLVVRTVGFQTRGSLPTENFLRSGVGRVIDLGAGTGRSTIMLLEARPRAIAVAYDLFGDSFDQHFGHSESPQARLLANLKTAGVDGRATIQQGDMRKLPFENASFEAVLTAYAIDHLGREGSKQALAEAARVLAPGGDFLMMIVENDARMKFAFGPLLSHGVRGKQWWRDRVGEAGFAIAEEGTRPATYYILAKRKSS